MKPGLVAFRIVVAALLVVTAAGCLIRPSSRARNPAQATSHQRFGPGQVTVSQVQAELIDAYDDLQVRLSERLLNGDKAELSSEQLARLYGFSWSVLHGSAVIVSGPNPVVSMLDLYVMLSLQRRVLERLPVEEYPNAEAVFGPPLRAAEAQVRSTVERALEPDQVAGLDGLITSWLAENPDRLLTTHVRFEDFSAARRQAVMRGRRGPQNLLGVLMIDPMAGLDPTTRELEQSRLFAERVFFFAERMPQLLEWQVQGVYFDLMSRPNMTRLLENADMVAEAAREAGETVAGLPELLEREREAGLERIDRLVEERGREAIDRAFEKLEPEREAAIDQAFDRLAGEREAMMATLREEDERLKGTLGELRATIEAGEALSASLTELAGITNEMTARMGLGERDAETPKPEDWRALIEEGRALTTELRELIGDVEHLGASKAWEDRLAEVDERLATVELSGARLVDRMFWRGLILIGVLLAGLGVLSFVRRGGARTAS